KLNVAFREPFRVFAKGDDFYFVTTSGKVFRAAKPAKGDDRTLEAVWEDAKRPVVAAVTDVVAERTFLFCQPEGNKGVFFDLAVKPEPRDYDASAIEKLKPDQERERSLERAKILKDAKLLKG